MSLKEFFIEKYPHYQYFLDDVFINSHKVEITFTFQNNKYYPNIFIKTDKTKDILSELEIALTLWMSLITHKTNEVRCVRAYKGTTVFNLNCPIDTIEYEKKLKEQNDN